MPINKNPKDETVHNFATSIGMNPDELETMVYSIISAFFNGGNSIDNKINIPQDLINSGMKIELEHLDKNNPFSKYFAEKIAKDHLTESLDYYTELSKIESEMKAIKTIKSILLKGFK